MKKIVASVGLVAIGASGLHADLLPGLTAESGKPWTTSATLRGFYDDNISTFGNHDTLPPGVHRDSYGFEVSPSLEFSFPMDQTTLSFGYVYSLKYYENKIINSSGHDISTHDFHAALNHAFSERYSVSAKDSFVIGQEPDFLRAGDSYTTFQRVSGNNIRNYGTIDWAAQLTPEFGIDLSYANTFLSYSDNASSTPDGTFTQYSNSGLLDMLDHRIGIDGRYLLQPQTTGTVGFQFRETDYTGHQAIGVYDDGSYIMSGDRNARSYYGYVGLDHNWRSDLSTSIRAGGRYTDYYNTLASQNQGSPYFMSSLKYTYLPESFLQFGGSYDYSPSAVAPSANQSNDINTSAQAGTVFASVNHRIASKLYGSILAQFQNTTYYGGTIDNKSAKFYLVGLNLQYRFTPNFSAEVGYNYDDLNSEVQSNYDRNRVYIGVTGSY
ncbi:MAG: outer membrane beta-barrel protein [Verrucomicrobia bacterium]|nr:outer membrane beta-barrel protein [Verrucomicrobiota bacterium]